VSGGECKSPVRVFVDGAQRSGARTRRCATPAGFKPLHRALPRSHAQVRGVAALPIRGELVARLRQVGSALNRVPRHRLGPGPAIIPAHSSSGPSSPHSLPRSHETPRQKARIHSSWHNPLRLPSRRIAQKPRRVHPWSELELRWGESPRLSLLSDNTDGRSEQRVGTRVLARAARASQEAISFSSAAKLQYEEPHSACGLWL
jgi:hypothetical protein